MWKSDHAQIRAYDLETLDSNYIISNAGLKSSEIFLQTIGFMIAVHDQPGSIDNCKKTILKYPNITHDMCIKCR
jgi:hypothetical protein